MATRTVKFLGKAYAASGDVSLAVSVNGNEVHNGTVTTNTPTGTEKTDDLYEMFTFDIDTSVTGWIPISVSVSNGEAYFGMLEGNYVGYETNESSLPTPINVDDVVLVTAPADSYADLNINTAESDGKRNVSISPVDGDVPTREVIDGSQLGEWHYLIGDGSTLTCEYYIDPDLDSSNVTIDTIRAAISGS